ncbi:MAG: hypothetical protein K8T91_07225 [Planctomycetes bacterium]|nr:hypothetical protein [Planctomycetota bacterium]
MISIQIDQYTAAMLEQQAQSRGISVAEYLRSLVPPPSSTVRPRWDELEAEIVALSTAGEARAADFSRADIYLDHD